MSCLYQPLVALEFLSPNLTHLAISFAFNRISYHMTLTPVVLNCIELSEIMTIRIVMTMFTNTEVMPTIS